MYHPVSGSAGLYQSPLLTSLFVFLTAHILYCIITADLNSEECIILYPAVQGTTSLNPLLLSLCNSQLTFYIVLLQLTLTLKNVSSCIRQCRALPVSTTYFSLGLGK